jgi:hypothetical protein
MANRRAAAVLCMAAMLAAGCTSADSDGEASPSSPSSAGVQTSLAPTSSPPDDGSNTGSSASATHGRARIYAHLFSRFAHHPSVQTGPFDTPVSLGVGGRRVRVLNDDDRYDPMKWRVPVFGYAERSGTASALEMLREQGRTAQVSNRPPPPCAAHTRPGLRLTGGGTLVRIQPRPGAWSSCIQWWSVDLFVNDVGQVVGVNINLGAP